VFVEWKDQIQPEIELIDASVKSYRIESKEKSIQSYAANELVEMALTGP
jgi:hypothetical protein